MKLNGLTIISGKDNESILKISREFFDIHEKDSSKRMALINESFYDLAWFEILSKQETELTLLLGYMDSYLHPELQVKFAKNIVNYIKEKNWNIIIITNQVTSLIALDYYSTKLNINKSCYLYDKELKDYSDNINELYANLTRPFLEIESKLEYIEEKDG